ncbi:MAG: alpha/beta fold hydrolase [Alphaproteobacteria bacterium]
MLTGPTIIPPNPTHTLVCLHGFGADGHDFIGLHAPLQANLPNLSLSLFCPNAPQRVPQFDSGYQWFSDKSWTFRDRDGIEAASQALWHYIHTEIITKLGIPPQNITVMGFSQGAMTALFSAPRWPHKIGGIIAHSGVLMWDDDMPPRFQTPPTLLLHGTDDNVVPADNTLHAAGRLSELGFPVESHLIPNLAHGVNAQSLAYISVFLQSVWMGVK